MTVTLRRTGLHAEDGFVAGADTLIVGTLVFLAALIIVINGWAVMDGKFAIDAAARETARYLVEAPAPATGATMAQARQVAANAMTAHGKNPAMIVVTLPSLARVNQRCGRVTVVVQGSVSTIRVPFVPVSTFGRVVTITSDHTEVVDPFRSGLDGVATCDD